MDSTNPIGLPRLAARVAAAAILLLLVAACAQTTDPGGGSQIARISGSLTFGVTGATVDSEDAAGATSESAPADRVPVGSAEAPSFRVSAAAGSIPFVPGEVIVRFASTGLAAQGAAPSLDVQGVRLSRARSLGLPQTGLYRASTTGRQDTLALVDALNARPDVVYAQPNYLLEPARVPNDSEYDRMWHYPFIGLEGAWDDSIGASDVVVAVLDTGMLLQHPDRPENLLPGYDFVSSLSNPDGDGRDSDPTDPGPRTVTGYHGSHVTGTVAAAANNDPQAGVGADGIAGVGWQTSVLPVRVLGSSGTTADIADGIVWSAGGSVSGVPANSNPAHIINLSLGGPLPCAETPAIQDAINQATAAGSVVVAAAGNQGDDASGYSPGSCLRVITVGAATLGNTRAPYSNFGPEVTLMAPGGELDRDRDSNGEPDGVLSLTRDDDQGQPGTYGFMMMQGTSMATPHVSGVISLMLDVNPGLTRSEIRSILIDTAEPYSSSQCDAGLSGRSLSGTDCGAGLIDAQAAVAAAAGTTPPPPPGDHALSFSPDSVVLGTESSSRTVEVTNTSTSTVTWQVQFAEPDEENPSDLGPDVLFIGPIEGSIAPGATQDVVIQIERANVDVAGAYIVYYAFDTDGDPSTAEAELPVTFIIESEEPAEVSGPMVVEALLEGDLARSGGVSSSGILRKYGFSVTPGSNLVYAWSDEDEDGTVDAGDWFGSYGDYVPVDPGENVTGIDIRLRLVQSIEEVGNALPEGVTLADLEVSRPTFRSLPTETVHEAPE